MHEKYKLKLTKIFQRQKLKAMNSFSPTCTGTTSNYQAFDIQFLENYDKNLLRKNFMDLSTRLIIPNYSWHV